MMMIVFVYLFIFYINILFELRCGKLELYDYYYEFVCVKEIEMFLIRKSCIHKVYTKYDRGEVCITLRHVRRSDNFGAAAASTVLQYRRFLKTQVVGKRERRRRQTEL